MANSKQITELIAATGVNSTDQLPLAQSGNNEAVRATVQQLAEAVGELNETGALRELELATSLGKNLLAQNLNEKGIEASPSDTLISLADKVGGLNIDTAVENITGYYLQSVTEESNPYGYYRIYTHPITNDMIILYYRTMYYVPYADNYTSFEDILNHAAHTQTFEVDLNVWERNYAVSEDFTKILIDLGSDNYEVYNYDSTNGFTRIKQFTKNLHPAGYYHTQYNVGIHDSGNFVCYITSYHVATMYNIDTNTDYPCDYGSGTAFNHGFCQILIKPSKIYTIWGESTTSSSYHCNCTVDYTITDGAVSYSNLQKGPQPYNTYPIMSADNSQWIHNPGHDDIPMLMCPSTYDTITNVMTPVLTGNAALYAANLGLFLFGPLNGQGWQTYSGPLAVQPSSSLVTLNAIAGAKACKLTYEGTTLKIKFPFIQTQLVLDMSAKPKILNLEEFQKEAIGLGVWPSARNSIFYATPTYCIAARCGNIGMPNAYNSNFYKYTLGESKQLIAKKRIVNANTMYYDTYISATKFDSGVCDLETTDIELEEESN